MGEKPAEESQKEPNLELPSLFGRRQKGRRAQARTEPERPAAANEPVEEAPSGAVVEEDRTGSDEEAASAPTVELDPAALSAATESTAAVPAPAGSPRPATPEVGEPPERPGRPERPEAEDHPETRATIRLPETAGEPEDTRSAPHPALEPTQPRRRGSRRASRRRTPVLPGSPAAVLSGLLVGLVGAGSTYGGLLGCDAVRGTTSCGGGPGLLLLAAILALMVLVGAGLLALLGVPEPRSTSFLGVGLTFVVVLVALMSAVFSAWMFFVAPVLSAVAYGAAHWVTTRNVELPERGPEHDVR